MAYVPQIDEYDCEFEESVDSTEQEARDIASLNVQAYENPEAQEEIQHIVHERQVFKDRWPRAIGIAQIILGFITMGLGLSEIFLIPALESPKDFYYPRIDWSNNYAAGLWAGFMLALTGSTAVRASISKRATTVYRYILFTVFTILVYVAAVILVVYGYSLGITTKDAFKINSVLYPVHIFMTISIMIGLLMTLTAFITYYEDVLFGELQLFHRFLSCILCCCNTERIT